MKPRELFGNYLFVLPALCMFFTFSVYPFYKVLSLSLFDWNGIDLTMQFVGSANFKEVLFESRTWWVSFRNAGYITLLALIFQNSLALFLALAVNKDLRGGSAYRVIFYLPPILSGIVVGLIFSWLYDGNSGFINHFLRSIGLGQWARSWLSDPSTALTAVSIIHMWKGFGWGFIIFLAGLQSIPKELYEAARVDGAGAGQRFIYITVPMMVPVFFLVSVLTILGTMQIFDIIISTTQGGPGYHTEVPITRILAAMLGSSRFGYACGMGIVFGAILLVVSIAQMQVSKRIQSVME